MNSKYTERLQMLESLFKAADTLKTKHTLNGYEQQLIELAEDLFEGTKAFQELYLEVSQGYNQNVPNTVIDASGAINKAYDKGFDEGLNLVGAAALTGLITPIIVEDEAVQVSPELESQQMLEFSQLMEGFDCGTSCDTE